MIDVIQVFLKVRGWILVIFEVGGRLSIFLKLGGTPLPALLAMSPEEVHLAFCLLEFPLFSFPRENVVRHFNKIFRYRK